MARKRIDWRYTATRRRKFLRKLAETYDVEAALGEAELSWAEVCELRVLHPEFAARFEEVIVAGYDRLEAMLLREAGIGAAAKADPALAQALIKLRRTSPARAGRAGKAGEDREAMIQSIMKMVTPLKAAAAGGAWNGSPKAPNLGEAAQVGRCSGEGGEGRGLRPGHSGGDCKAGAGMGPA
jgi:hypothetical protein